MKKQDEIISAHWKKLFFTGILLITAVTLWAQQNQYSNFYSESLKTNNTGMYVLGSWAAANMGWGAIGWANNSGSEKYFHQMNLFWNTVNLSIAGIAIYGNYNQDVAAMLSGEMLQKHIKTENLFLINGGLDIVYVGTGFLLKHLANNSQKRHDLLKGYGNSIILQGSFLFTFDIAMWAIQRSHRLQFLQNIELSLASLPNLNEFTATFTF